MSSHIFASVARNVGRRVAPVLLAVSTLCGTVGYASVASADEVVVTPAVAEIVVPRPAEKVVVEKVVRPAAEQVVVEKVVRPAAEQSSSRRS